MTDGRNVTDGSYGGMAKRIKWWQRKIANDGTRATPTISYLYKIKDPVSGCCTFQLPLKWRDIYGKYCIEWSSQYLYIVVPSRAALLQTIQRVAAFWLEPI